jgi:hypothetical protein
VDPPPSPAPPVQALAAPQPLTAVLVNRRRRRRRLVFVRVFFSDTGIVKKELRSPFQKPLFRGLSLTLLDSDGDGVFDTLRLTARKGKKTVQRLLPL